MRVICSVVVLTLALARPAAGQTCGDCNGDTQLTIIDALFAAQHAAAVITLVGTSFTACNVLGVLEPDPAASVNILDALTLAQAAAALPVTLTCAAPPPVNQPPVVDIIAPTAGTWASPVSLVFDTQDGDGDPLDLDVAISTDGGATWAAATADPSGSVSTNPALGVPPAIGLVFRWDSSADMIGLAAPVSVDVRISADDGIDQASDQVTLSIDNRPPPPPPCPQVTPAAPVPLVCGCALEFPPAASIPCPIAEPGTRYYLNPVSGNDMSSGTSPGAAWRSLCASIPRVPAGSTLLVAEGTIDDADIDVGTGITVKGGYDATFTFWDPDTFPTVLHGRLTLDHPDVVFGGFQLITDATITGNVYWHNLIEGTFVRNYCQAVFRATSSYSVYYLVMQTPVGGVINLLCNDVYVRNELSSGIFRGVRFYVFSGTGRLENNRICAERASPGGSVYTVAGYGPCTTSPASIVMANNVIETPNAGGRAIELYGCGDAQLDIMVTNNTILSAGDGITGYGGSSGTNTMAWRLTNNIVFSGGGGGTAVNVASSSPTRVEITTAEGNLIFGYASNQILPVPLAASGNDTGGAHTPGSVFVAPAVGDFEPLVGGPAIDLGLNVFGLAPYGGVTQDLELTPRPPAAPWERGALER